MPGVKAYREKISDYGVGVPRRRLQAPGPLHGRWRDRGKRPPCPEKADIRYNRAPRDTAHGGPPMTSGHRFVIETIRRQPETKE